MPRNGDTGVDSVDRLIEDVRGQKLLIVIFPSLLKFSLYLNRV
jgi:hypothetical protein